MTTVLVLALVILGALFAPAHAPVGRLCNHEYVVQSVRDIPSPNGVKVSSFTIRCKKCGHVDQVDDRP
jgi:hypothetical protein